MYNLFIKYIKEQVLQLKLSSLKLMNLFNY